MSDDPTPGDNPDEGTSQSFTQADVDRIVADRLKREREAVKTKYADYDDIKAKASEATTAEQRIAALEQEIQSSKRDALRAKYAADVPERLRPLLTGTTEDELKAQRDLIVAEEKALIDNGNHVPREGETPKPGDDPMREFTRGVFARAKNSE